VARSRNHFCHGDVSDVAIDVSAWSATLDDPKLVNSFFQTASPYLVMHITTSADNLIRLKCCGNTSTMYLLKTTVDLRFED
jgi:hypothetical protein